jgi:uncharacterized protein YjcR
MTDEQKNSVKALRETGISYTQIAEQLGLSANTVKSFCRRSEAAKMLCKNCGKPLEQARKRKPKTFCGDWCRREWWRRNRDKIRRNAIYHLSCAHCGRHFESYGNRGRKYCSHDCYIRDRFGDASP